MRVYEKELLQAAGHSYNLLPKVVYLCEVEPVEKVNNEHPFSMIFGPFNFKETKYYEELQKKLKVSRSQIESLLNYWNGLNLLERRIYSVAFYYFDELETEAERERYVQNQVISEINKQIVERKRKFETYPDFTKMLQQKSHAYKIKMHRQDFEVETDLLTDPLLTGEKPLERIAVTVKQLQPSPRLAKMIENVHFELPVFASQLEGMDHEQKQSLIKRQLMTKLRKHARNLCTNQVNGLSGDFNYIEGKHYEFYFDKVSV